MDRNRPSGGALVGEQAVSQIGRIMGRMAAILLVAVSTAGAGEPAARDLCLEGVREMESGNLAGALRTLRAAREAFALEEPRREEVADFLALHLYNLGVRFNNRGDPGSALESFVETLRLTRLSPKLRDTAFREGLLTSALSVAGHLAATGRSEKPLEAFSLIEEVGAGGDERRAATIASGRGRIALAAAGSDPARLEQAVEWLRRGLEPGSHRDLAGALLRLAAARARGGEIEASGKATEEAERVLRQAISREPDSPWARIDLATDFLRQRRYQEAASLLAEAESILGRLLAVAPDDRDAGAWRKARDGSRENRAVALYNLAVDAVNRAAFDSVEGWLVEVCGISPMWEETCRGFRLVARAREETFRGTVEALEKATASDPSRAGDLLALGDLYANLGAWDKALGWYRRLESLQPQTTGLRDRIAAVVDPGQLAQRRRRVVLPGGEVELLYYRDAAGAELEAAVRAAWLRVSSSLGAAAMQGPLRVMVYPNRRTFRERAGYRVGGLVKGNYGRGQVSFFETPSQTVVEWVSVLTHELAHHAVERLSGGASPRWLSEGVARFVEGETAVVDRTRLVRRLAAPGLAPLSRLDELMDRSWNDPEVYLDMRDVALLAVEEMARRGGSDGLRQTLASLRDPSADLSTVILRLHGITLDQLDDLWRAALKREVNGEGR